MERFSKDTSIITCDVDIDILINERSRNTVWGDSTSDVQNYFTKINFSLTPFDLSNLELARKINPYPFVPDTSDQTIIAER